MRTRVPRRRARGGVARVRPAEYPRESRSRVFEDGGPLRPFTCGPSVRLRAPRAAGKSSLTYKRRAARRRPTPPGRRGGVLTCGRHVDDEVLPAVASDSPRATTTATRRLKGRLSAVSRLKRRQTVLERKGEGRARERDGETPLSPFPRVATGTGEKKTRRKRSARKEWSTARGSRAVPLARPRRAD